MDLMISTEYCTEKCQRKHGAILHHFDGQRCTSCMVRLYMTMSFRRVYITGVGCRNVQKPCIHAESAKRSACLQNPQAIKLYSARIRTKTLANLYAELPSHSAAQQSIIVYLESCTKKPKTFREGELRRKR